MNTTQVCVAGIVAVVALGFIADVKARFKKPAPKAEATPRMTKEEMHRAVMARAAKEHSPEVCDVLDILGRVNADTLYR